ncbi:conjugative transposon protein TraM [Flavobacterium daejeonense]|uniref:conjugative transposon protein TraM n=1 Tax=Flavobacterium daejeonense TaxID=350893 RepID=UPI00047B666E|nr:conjugative transposon protein TraM [Flavobacterium daejeonense]
MAKINFKQQKYILPLILFPFTILGFYLYKDTFKDEPKTVVVGNDGMQSNISDVSESIKDRELKDKLENYENSYKDANGYSAISELEEEELPTYQNGINSKNDDLDNQILTSKKLQEEKAKGYNPIRNQSNENKELLALFKKEKEPVKEVSEKEEDYNPIKMMQEQARLMDSLNKANDPEYQEELKRLKKQEAFEKEKANRNSKKLAVQKASSLRNNFNTIKPVKANEFIKAIIDENTKGYAGSRIRIKLLEDIKVGTNLLKKGTYLYAIINGFTEQRVMMKVISVMYQNKILPVNLDVFDLDGMLGLYVPASAFRDFTKELGSTTMQGQDISSGNSEDFVMSTIGKAFQSTSQALATAIRKNKAKFKYSTYIFLIDQEELKNQNN